MKKVRPLLKTASYAMLVLFVNQILFPMYSYAITGGANMPEYSSFEPVSTTNMVNEFDGSFTYNLPLMNVPNGYPINLSYHSNSVNNEALASWVGLGWNINPGAVNRSKAGFPDEYNGREIIYHQRMPSNWTIGATFGLNMEFFAKEATNAYGKKDKTDGLISANLSQTTSFNNNVGLGTSMNFGVSDFAGVANINASFANGRYNGATYSINPLAILNLDEKEVEFEELKHTGTPLTPEASRENAFSNVGTFNSNLAKAKSEKYKLETAPVTSFGAVLGSNTRTIPSSIAESVGIMTSLKFQVGTTFLPISIKTQGAIQGTFSFQKNRYQQKTNKVYGYLHSDDAKFDDEGLQDFTMELEAALEKNDEVVGYPMANSDRYVLSGEAFGGAFESVRGDFGYFRPNKVNSTDVGVEAAGSYTAPTNFTAPILINFEGGVGGMLASNYHHTLISEWKSFMDADHEFQSNSEFEKSKEKSFYLFAGDMAGYYDITEENGSFNDRPLVPSLSGTGVSDGHYAGSRKMDFRSQGRQKQRSTFISTHTNKDFWYEGKRSGGGVKAPFKTYQKNLKIFVKDGQNLVPEHYDYSKYPADAIAEIVTTNKDGLTYVYGLPVYEKNEKNISYSFENLEGLISNSSSAAFSEDGLIFHVNGNWEDGDSKTKVGQEDGNKYPTAYLLTEILTPDYVDRKGDGPTEDDFGSYTKFSYERVHGGTDKWYAHRSPYKGVGFAIGSLSSKKDDIGNFTYGEKEVYLLHQIDSKTHFAKFTTSARDDGRGVGVANGASAEAIAKWDNSGSSRGQLNKLDKIELFSKSDNNTEQEILTTCHFDYTYDLGGSVPNSSSGKLTLKRVWVEHGGVTKNRVQPYIFEYEYPNTTYALGGTYSENYGNDINFYKDVPSNLQNPGYMAVNTDPWGNYRNYAEDKADLQNSGSSKNLKRFFPFVNQNPESSEFDPSAYLLKNIKLPSGGEIRVQYEQHDYSYVQSKRAMVMVPLLSGWTDNKEKNNKKYFLDITKVGLTMPADVADQKKMGNQLFESIKNGDRLYFKFLYGLVGGTPNYATNTAEFLDGFSMISAYGVEGNKFFFTFDKSSPDVGNPGVDWFINVPKPPRTTKREIPQKICRDFYKSKRRMLIDGGSNAVGLSDALDNGDEEAAGNGFLGIMKSAFQGSFEKCKYMDPEMSYVRLNLPLGTYGKRGKLAGGVRVKRLLMYDQSNSATDPVSLYGHEYLYVTEDKNLGIISSGVAQNETGALKMENPWVLPIDKSEISAGEAILGGSYLYKHLGPIGFGFMPSQAIGYSKVTKRPIHAVKTGMGYNVKEFYTYKEFPTFMTSPGNDAPSPQYGKTPSYASSFGLAGFSVTNESFTGTQGMVVHLNDMHGKIKRETHFPQDMGTEVSSTVYHYVNHQNRGDDQAHQFTTMKENMDMDGTTRLGEFGRVVKQHGYTKNISDVNISVSASKDVDGIGGIAYPGWPLPLPNFLLKLAKLSSPVRASVTNINFNTVSVSKVVRHSAILASVETNQEGIKSHTKNEVFDYYTGDPVIKSYKDEFDKGTYIEQAYKGTWNYKGMRSKYLNEGLVITPSVWGLTSITGATTNNQSVITFNPNGSNTNCDFMGSFTVGDYLQIRDQGASTSLILYHITEVDEANFKLIVQKSMHSFSALPSNIDRIEILKSGFTNQMNMEMGKTLFFDPDFNSGYYSTSVEGIQYESNTFTTQLNDMLDSFGPGLSSGQTFILPGPFTGADMSNLNTPDLGPDCPDAVVTNVSMGVAITGTTPKKVNIYVNSYEFECTDGSKFRYLCSEQGNSIQPISNN